MVKLMTADMSFNSRRRIMSLRGSVVLARDALDISTFRDAVAGLLHWS